MFSPLLVLNRYVIKREVPCELVCCSRIQRRKTLPLVDDQRVIQPHPDSFCDCVHHQAESVSLVVQGLNETVPSGGKLSIGIYQRSGTQPRRASPRPIVCKSADTCNMTRTITRKINRSVRSDKDWGIKAGINRWRECVSGAACTCNRRWC